MAGCCLTIAGADSGGGAGVEADLRTFHAYGLHGCTVHTAITAQNPFGVFGVHYLPADFIAAQLDAVLGVYDIRALKTGMMAGAEATAAIAERLARHPEIAKVIDPVMIATSGKRLTDDASVEVMVRDLMPLATLITPNLPEAKALADRWRDTSAIPDTSAGAAELARILNGELGVAVLVKGGHAGDDGAVDVLFDGRDISRITLPRVESPVSTHGTGCTFASATSAELALGEDLLTAVRGAKSYVHKAIATSYSVGNACGVLGW